MIRRPEPHEVWAAVAVAIGTTVGAVAVLTVSRSTLSLAAGGALMLALACLPRFSPYAAIALGLATFPSVMQTRVHPGSLIIFVFEPVLLIAVVYTAIKVKPAVHRQALAGAVVVLTMFLVGWWQQTDSTRNAQEALALLDLIGALYVGAGLIRAGRTRELRLVISAVLMWSATLICLAATTGFSVGGRIEIAHIGSVNTEATRLLTETQFLALAVFCACTVAALTGATTFRRELFLWAPAACILMLSFSRNTLVGVGVALLLALLLSPRRVQYVGRVLAAGTAVVLALVVGGYLSSGTRIGNWLSTQVTAYSDRVFGGITAAANGNDPSALSRLREQDYLVRHLFDSPVYGHGLGYAYQPRFGLPGSFTDTIGIYYAHNFWLWLLMKGGFILAAAFIVATCRPVWRRHTWTSPSGVVAASTAVALMAVCLVAPLPLEGPNSLAFGLVLGVLAQVAATKQPATQADVTERPSASLTPSQRKTTP